VDAVRFLRAAHKVYDGISTPKNTRFRLVLPRKDNPYVNYLDSLLINPSLINKEEGVFKTIFSTKSALQEYRAIQKKRMEAIALDSTVKSYKVGDSATATVQIRTRLLLPMIYHEI
jgi:hypothetical protein